MANTATVELGLTLHTVGCNITAEIAQPGCRLSPRTYSQQYQERTQ
jgi:hypothetical protein